jgi:hypothetical protein
MSITPVFTTDVSLCIANINSRKEPSTVTINCSYTPGFLPNSSYAMTNKNNTSSTSVYTNNIVTKSNSGLLSLSSMAIDNSNNIYFATGSNNQSDTGIIYIYVNSTNQIINISQDYQGRAFSNPTCLAVDRVNNYFYVFTNGYYEDGDGKTAFQYTINTSYTNTSLITFRQRLNVPNNSSLAGNTFTAVTTDISGNLYIGSCNFQGNSNSLFYYDYETQLSLTPYTSYNVINYPGTPLNYSQYSTFGVTIDNTNNYLYASFTKYDHSVDTSNCVIQYSLTRNSSPTLPTLSTPKIIFSGGTSGLIKNVSSFLPYTISVDLSYNLYVNSGGVNINNTNTNAIYMWNPSSPSLYKTIYIGEYDSITPGNISYYFITGVTNDKSNNLYFYLNNYIKTYPYTQTGYCIAKLNPNLNPQISLDFSNLPLQIGNASYNIIDTNTQNKIFNFNLYSGTIKIDYTSVYTGNATITIYYKGGILYPSIASNYVLKNLSGTIVSEGFIATNDYINFNINLLGANTPYYLYYWPSYPSSSGTLLSIFYQDYNPLIVGQYGPLIYNDYGNYSGGNFTLVDGNKYILIDASYGNIVSEPQTAGTATQGSLTTKILSFNAVNLNKSDARNYYIYNCNSSGTPTSNTNLTLALNGVKINTYPENIYSNSAFCIYFKNSDLIINGGSYTLISSKLSAPVNATASYDNFGNNIIIFKNLSVNPGTGTYNIFYNDTNNNFPSLDQSFSILTFNLNALPIVSGELAQIAYQSAFFSNGANYALTDSNGNTVSDIVTYYTNSYNNITFTGVNIQTTSAIISNYYVVQTSTNAQIIQIPISVGTMKTNENPTLSNTAYNSPSSTLTFSHPNIQFSSSYIYKIQYNGNDSSNETQPSSTSNLVTFTFLQTLRGYYLYNIISNNVIIASFYLNAITLLVNQPCNYTFTDVLLVSQGIYNLSITGENINITGGANLVCDSNNTINFPNLTLSTTNYSAYLNVSKQYTLQSTGNPTVNFGLIFDVQGSVITSPSPLIQQQPGSVTFYNDLSYNNCPINSNKYFLQLVNNDGSVTNLSTFVNTPTGENILNYQTIASTPQAITFDLLGNLYITNISTNNITAFNPGFQQYYSTEKIVSPYGIKFNPSSGLLFITCLGVCETDSNYGAIYSMTPPNYKYNSTSTAVFSPVFNYNTRINNTQLGNNYSTYCKYPYDIEFDPSGNIIVSNFGSYTNSPNTSNGFITKLFLQNGTVVDAAVIISSVSSTTTTSALGNNIPSIQDLSLNYPSGIAYDMSNNYLYVANVTSTSFNAGSITTYNMNTFQILGTFQTSFVGNTNACPNFGTSQSVPVTTLKLDNYGNLYYLYFDTINTYVNVLKPGNNVSTGVFQAPLIYSHMIKNITDNSSYGLTFNNGNIYVSGNVITNTTSILQIQTSYQFNNATLQSGNNQLQIVNATNNNPISYLNLFVPASNLSVSNTPRYANQSTIVSYYDNPNQANTCLPKGGFIYRFVNNADSSNYSNVQINQNNETIYANYKYELGSLSFPISMDYDNSGNLYVLNAPSSTQSSQIFLSIITPKSGNLGKIYNSNISLINPSVIRYNKNDNCMYIGVYGINTYGNIYKVITTQQTNGIDVKYNITCQNFYSNNTFCYRPIDIVFDQSITGIGLGSSVTGNMYISNYGNTTISKIPLIYKATTYPPVTSTTVSSINTPITLVNSNYLSPYLSGIAVDSSYVYIVNTPNNSGSNILSNIGQFSNSQPNKLIQYWNSQYVGKLNDATYSPIQPVSSPLKFDEYGNLFYIYSYIQSQTNNTIVNVQAFVPSSGVGTPVYLHTMVTNATSPIYGMAIYRGDIYVAQYKINTIIKIINTFSFSNYGFGISGSQKNLILPSQSNTYSILGGQQTITNITIDANILNYTFNTATIVTTPSPLLTNTPGTLYYYNNPATSGPTPNTSYNLIDSNNKVVSGTYISTAGNETTIINDNLCDGGGLTVDNQGYLYVANIGVDNTSYQYGSIIKFTPSGQIIYNVVNNYILNPKAIKFNQYDGYIYYSNTTPITNGTSVYFYIYRMNTDGTTFTKVYEDSSYNYLCNPQDLCFDSTGNIYVSNSYFFPTIGDPIGGSITKITMSYTSGIGVPYSAEVFSNYLTGLSTYSWGFPIVTGLAIDIITNNLYVVTGSTEPTYYNINISQIPITGNDAGYVCRQWKTGSVGVYGQSALTFDPYGNLYYYYYNETTKIGQLNAFNPYTNSESTYSHTLLGGPAAQGAYGVIYYNGNLYSSQFFKDSVSGNYHSSIVEINASYYFTDVTLQSGNNVLSIQNTSTNQVVVSNIQVYVPYAKYYTIPSPPVAGQPAQLIYEYDGVIVPVNGDQYVIVDNNMHYVSSVLTYNSSSASNPNVFNFTNLILPGGANYLFIFDITQGKIINGSNIFIKIPVVCFYKGTKILCAINGKEAYVPIEKIGQGTLVKTYKHGYKRVKYNVKGKLSNTSEHGIDKLYKLSKKRFPELMEDLYVTGSHALLHDSLTERDIILMRKVIQYAATNYNSIYHAKIEDKYKLLAYHDERFEEIMQNAIFEIYHIVLESEDECFNYGIYANGVLAESTDELTLMRMKGFEKINKTPEKMEKFLMDMSKSKYPSQVKRALNPF